MPTTAIAMPMPMVAHFLTSGLVGKIAALIFSATQYDAAAVAPNARASSRLKLHGDLQRMDSLGGTPLPLSRNGISVARVRVHRLTERLRFAQSRRPTLCVEGDILVHGCSLCRGERPRPDYPMFELPIQDVIEMVHGGHPHGTPPRNQTASLGRRMQHAPSDIGLNPRIPPQSSMFDEKSRQRGNADGFRAQ
jgi:hypothetical protein